MDVPSPSGRIRVRVQRRCFGPEGDGGGGPGAVDEASAGAAVIAVPPPRPTWRPHVGVLHASSFDRNNALTFMLFPTVLCMPIVLLLSNVNC